jgi:hypothetical protein
MSRVYSLSKIAKPVGTGVSKSYWLELFAVGKNTGNCHFTVANEFICARLGSFLGLPIPPFALLQQKGRTDVWFGSIDYNLTGQSLPPIDSADCVAEFPALSTGIVLFDVWIANTDRHTGNLNMDQIPGKPARLNVFDHSHALFRFDGEVRANQLINQFAITEKTEAGANRHCLLDDLNTADFFEDWHKKFDQMPDYLIEETCATTVEAGILSSTESTTAIKFLKTRKSNLRDLIKQNRKEFKSIDPWPLLF